MPKTVTLTAEALDELVLVGSMMSNVCFNLSQHKGERIEDRAAAAMKDLQRKWDAAAAVVHGQRKRAKGAPDAK